MACVKTLSQLGSQDLKQLEDISQWGLPSAIVDNYHERGVKRMFPWQVQCLLASGVLQGRNLVYSAPTSAGKTLVAELLMLKRVLETRKKAIMILPFVSVTREKMFHFQNLFSSGGLRVGGFMGSHFPVGGLQSIDIAVCTIEKSNALINKLLEDQSLDLLCCVVVDELHMLGEPQRGYLLELLLTKLLYFQRHSPASSLQLIGMSATLPNLDLVSSWLDASLYRTDYRPVPLTECVKIGNEPPLDIVTRKTAEIPILQCALPSSVDDSDGCLSLVVHTVSQGFGVLVFLPTKVWCETMSQQIARTFLAVGKPPQEPDKVDPELLRLGADLRAVNKRNEIQEVLEKLRQTPAGLDETLKKTIPYGVAFHHAGLTYDERDIIENAFKAGVLNVLTATSTLSSGVNLPARRVVIRTPIFARQLLDALTYRQMIGRAGRKGIDDRGESILVCKDREREQAMKLATMHLAPVRSCLASYGSVSSALKRAILEVIASGVVKTLAEVEKYIKCTFLNECAQAQASHGDEVVEVGRGNVACSAADACIEYLVKNDFVKVSPEENNVQAVTPTKLAAAVLASSLSPDQALLVLRELGKSRQSFVLENDLHIIYEVTPYFISEQATIDYSTLSEFYDALTEDRRRVADLVGFDLGFVYKSIRGAATKRDKEMKEALHRRFYVALALNELVQEVPLSEVSSKFGLQKGMLQNLQQSAATFAGMMAIFCKRLGWHNLELLIAQFQKRLHFGVQQELCELLQLIPVTAQAARILFNAGFIALPELARAQIHEVEAAFRAARSYQPKEGESSSDVRWIYLNGFDGVTEREAARLLIDEARKTLHDWLGVKVNFDKQEQAFSQQAQTEEDQQVDDKRYKIGGDESIATPMVPELIANERASQGSTNGEYRENDVRDRNGTVATGCTASRSVCSGTAANYQTDPDSDPISRIAFTQRDDVTHSDTSGLASTREESRTLVENSKIKIDKGEIGDISSTKIETQLRSDCEKISERRSSVSRVSLNSSRIMGENSFHNGVQHYSTPNRSPLKDELRVVEKSSTSFHAASSARSSDFFNEYESPNRSRTSLPSLEAAVTRPGDSDRGRDVPVQNAEGDSMFDGVTIQEKNRCETRKSDDRNTNADTGDSSIFDDIITQPDEMSTVEERTTTSPVSDKKVPGLAAPEQAYTVTNLRVTPTKLKMLEAESEKFRIELRTSVKRESDEDVSPNEKKSKPNSSRSLEEVFNQERRSASDDSMAFFNSSQMKNITQNAKTELELRDQSRAGQHGNDSDQLFECVLTCQSVVGTKNDNPSASAAPTTGVGSLAIVDMVSTLPACSNTQPACIEDTDSDLFSDGENAPNTRLDKSKISYEISDDEESSLDLHLTSSSSSWMMSNSLGNCSSPILAGAEIQCIRDLPEERLFERIEAAGRRFALSLESEAMPASVQIGPAILGSRPSAAENVNLVLGDKRIVGFCVSVGPSEGMFYPLKSRDDQNASIFRKLFEPSRGYTVALFDCLDQLKVIMTTLGVVPDSDAVQFEDAAIAHWLLDSSTCSCPSLDTLRRQYCPSLPHKAENRQVTNVPRSCIECCTHMSVLRVAVARLDAAHISREIFRKEMRICAVLARIDLNGFGYDDKTCEAQINAMRELQFRLETKMISKAQRTFKTSSSAEVSRVIYSLFKDKLIKYKIITGREPPNKLRLSSKAVLLKLAEEDPLPQWIVDARKIASILAKDMFPVLRAKEFHSGLNQHRIYTHSSPYTATGRMALNEPNLQSMARNFHSAGEEILIRRGFVPMPEGVLLSADFSQLEMRLLAHLSGDSLLCQMFSDPEGDIFVHVAAQWKRLQPSEVSTRQRQQAKELCYGIIYGKGVKSLSEDLGVTEEEGEIFLKSFHATFPGIQKYTSKVISTCQQLGYIETMFGRRRYLPHIKSPNVHLKAKAKRQAVNSTIQGSAADLLKSCLIEIDAELAKRFPEASKPHRSYGGSTRVPIRGAFIVMQLHDEIILEVHKSVLSTVAQLVRFKMERAASLRVPLVVKVKTGPHWSSVTPFEWL